MGELIAFKQQITQRFLEAMEYVIEVHQLRIQKVFAENIGVENHHISNLNIGKSQVNAWMIANFVDKYREVNPDYILTGNGEMTRELSPAFKTAENLQEHVKSLYTETDMLRKQVQLLQGLLAEKHHLK